METSRVSFLSCAERCTLKIYKHSNPAVSEGVGRLAASILLSPAAALDLVLHSLLLLPTTVYALGKSVYQRQVDCTLPWQHLQRIRNAVAPLLLGSVLGVLHPYAGLIASEPTDKHVVLGVLCSHVLESLLTPCSPIHSLSIIERIAKKHRYAPGQERKEIFPPEYVKILQDARGIEESLEQLQAQEFMHKMTNLTFVVMKKTATAIQESCLSGLSKAVLLRASGLLVPLLTVVDMTVTLLVQAFFLLTGVARLVSGRGPIYTEITAYPLMHISFFIQCILKGIGNLLGTLCWFGVPRVGFLMSLLPPSLFFKFQMNALMLQIKLKMHLCKEKEGFVVPVAYPGGTDVRSFVPFLGMHMTYLIVQQSDALWTLSWINRPNMFLANEVSCEYALGQIRSFLEHRFPFIEIEKVMNGPIECKSPVLKEGFLSQLINKQGGAINCGVSNLFGMFEALDGDEKVQALRARVVREALMKDYGFYESDFSPFTGVSNGYSLTNDWNIMKQYRHWAI